MSLMPPTLHPCPVHAPSLDPRAGPRLRPDARGPEYRPTTLRRGFGFGCRGLPLLDPLRDELEVREVDLLRRGEIVDEFHREQLHRPVLAHLARHGVTRTGIDVELVLEGNGTVAGWD